MLIEGVLGHTDNKTMNVIKIKLKRTVPMGYKYPCNVNYSEKKVANWKPFRDELAHSLFTPNRCAIYFYGIYDADIMGRMPKLYPEYIST